MIVILKQNPNPDQLESLISWLKEKGVTIHRSVGETNTILGLVGDTSRLDIDLIAALDIVEDVKRVQEPYKKCNRKFHPEDSVIPVGNTHVGGGNLTMIAGPCAVESEEQIEPMSAWKWRQTYELAMQTQLAPILYDGVEDCEGQFYMQLPADLKLRWGEEAARAARHYDQSSGQLAQLMELLGTMQLRPVITEPWAVMPLHRHPEHHIVEGATIFFPYETQGRKADEWARASGSNCDDTHRHLLRYKWQSLQVEHRHRLLTLNNRLTNSTLQGIVEQERLEGGTAYVTISNRRMETTNATLTMLVALLNIVRTSLDEGLRLWQLVDLGVLLRRQGDRMDFVKLQEWIERLRFTRMSQLVATALTGLLGFAGDEVPFVPASKIGGDVDDLADTLLRPRQRSTRYFRYNPGEGIASVVASITHRLGNVKE